MRVFARFLVLMCIVSATACTGDSDGGDDPVGDSGGEADGIADVAGDVDDGDAAVVDVPPDDAGSDPEVTPDPDICDAMDLFREPFQESAGGFEFGDIAGDFTVTQLDGTDWSLAENWTGCESYVFLPYIQDLRQNGSGPWVGDTIWTSGPSELMTEGPRNVHYFFASLETTEAARIARVSEMRGRFNAALLVQSPEDAAHWAARFHFVTNRLTDIPGSVGNYVEDYFDYLFSDEGIVDLGERGRAQPPLPFSFAIGRDQQWDPGGSLSEYVGGPSNSVMASYLGHFFNHRAATRRKVATEADTTTVVTLADENVLDRVFVKTVDVPDAATMATFDTLEFDVDIRCLHRNPFGCSEWDRIAHIQYCMDGELCEERLEIARWITQYWRRGSRRWIMDASPFLGLLQAGGSQSFRIIMGPEFERKTERHVRLDIRLSDQGGPKSRAVTRLWGGGGFDEAYNDDHPPSDFDVPQGATRTELVVILSGHGQESGNNCAEWCDHRHEFTLSGIPIADIRSEIPIGSSRGCAHLAHRGVPPGQWGNWSQGRAYWCPGLPVDAMRFDMTTRVAPGASARMNYRANFAGGEPEGGSISLNVYVVSYGE